MPKKKEKTKVYVTHTCKNRECEAAFVDTDDNNAQFYPPRSKYCPKCRRKKEFRQEGKSKRGQLGGERLRQYWANKKRKQAQKKEAASVPLQGNASIKVSEPFSEKHKSHTKDLDTVIKEIVSNFQKLDRKAFKKRADG